MNNSSSDPRSHAADSSSRESAPLPSGLYLQVGKQVLGAAICTIITVVAVLYTKDPHYLVGFLIAGVLAYLAVSIVYDWKSGIISEDVLVCSSVTLYSVVGVAPDSMKKSAKLVFHDQADPPNYFEFRWPSGRNIPFEEHKVYCIYQHPKKPREIIGYTAL